MWYTTEHLISNKISSQISHYIITCYLMNDIQWYLRILVPKCKFNLRYMTITNSSKYEV